MNSLAAPLTPMTAAVRTEGRGMHPALYKAAMQGGMPRLRQLMVSVLKILNSKTPLAQPPPMSPAKSSK